MAHKVDIETQMLGKHSKKWDLFNGLNNRYELMEVPTVYVHFKRGNRPKGIRSKIKKYPFYKCLFEVRMLPSTDYIKGVSFDNILKAKEKFANDLLSNKNSLNEFVNNKFQSKADAIYKYDELQRLFLDGKFKYVVPSLLSVTTRVNARLVKIGCEDPKDIENTSYIQYKVWGDGKDTRDYTSKDVVMDASKLLYEKISIQVVRGTSIKVFPR